MSNTKEVKNLIIGAGLSGMSCAYFLGDDYLILEKDQTPGGYCRTIPNKEYVWDYAGHFYHFRTKRFADLFLGLVEPEQIIKQRKNTKIYYNGKLIDYPFQTNIHQLEKEEFMECLYDLYFRDEGRGYEDFLDMLYVKFGRAITEKFLRPYNEKLYATDLHSLDKDAMGRFFPYADFRQVMESIGNIQKETYNDEFMYLKSGTGYFIDKLYQELDHEKIHLNVEVTSVDKKNKIVELANGERIKYENLINSAPFNEFLQLLNDDSGKLAERLSYNKVLVFNLGFDKASPNYKEEHWVYFPDKNLNFYRIGFYNNILNSEKLSVYVELGYPKNSKDIDVENELKKVLSGMKEVGIIDDSVNLVDKSILCMDPAYVHIATAEQGDVEKKMKQLEEDNIYMLGRYGRWTYNSMEDCMQLAEDLAHRLHNE